MGDFEFPTNIKQIGSIGDGLRIYMEDYVFSYLQQYADAAGYEERLAMLIGRDLIIDNQKVLFISGAVQGKYTVLEDGVLNFTEKSWDYANDQIDKYFSGMEIVGWMQSQPGYGVFLNPEYAEYHVNNFILPYQVLFLVDPAEKVNAFYIWESGTRQLVETNGYFIYYDKNRGMHDYMLDNKIVKMMLATQDYMPEYDEEEPASKKEMGPIEMLTLGTPKKEGLRKDKPAAKVLRSSVSGSAGNTPHRLARRNQSRNQVEQKRVLNMLVTLSAVLFVISFIMGAGLIQNDGRITTLEQQLSLLSTAYSSVVEQIRQDKTEAVFAAQEVRTEAPADLILEDGSKILAQEAMAAVSPSPTTTLVPVTTPEPSPQPTPVPVTPVPATPEPATPVPESASTVEAAPERTIPKEYVVQQGDNLLSISRKFYGSSDMASKIMEVNQMDDPNKIYYGKVLLLP